MVLAEVVCQISERSVDRVALDGAAEAEQAESHVWAQDGVAWVQLEAEVRRQEAGSRAVLDEGDEG
jgi:hypothetical protein